MTWKRLVAAIAIVSVLYVPLTPKPARAVDTAWLVLGSIAAYVTAVCIGAWLVFRDTPNPPLMPSPTDVEGPWEQHQEGVRLGLRCAQDSGNLTIACW
jgi:hypothetical protein